MKELQQLHLQIPSDLLESIEIYARAMDITPNDAIIRAIVSFLETQGHEEAVMAFLDKAMKQYRNALDELAR